MTSKHSSFRKRLLDKELLIGTFQKTPSMMISEVLANTEIDVVCIDAEHSPFDRRDIDASVFAFNAANKPSLVRIPSGAPEQILNALDCGATGIIVPHVDSVEKADSIAKASRFGDKGRGYAGSTRAANYTGNSVAQNIENNKSNAVIIQIEDLAALPVIDEIAAIDGIDCLFIGTMDLAIALDCSSPKDQAVVDAALNVCKAAAENDRRTGIFVADLDDVSFWKNQGVNLFLLGSDHAFIKQGVSGLLSKTK